MTTDTEGLDLQTQEPETEVLDCSMMVPMVDYVTEKAKDPDACVPCGLGVITPWYRDELAEKGYGELAAEVAAIDPEKVTNLEVAEMLDRIRETVTDDATRERLDNFNCRMQIFVNEEATQDGADAPPGLDTDAVDVPE